LPGHESRELSSPCVSGKIDLRSRFCYLPSVGSATEQHPFYRGRKSG